jgi:hypothetical protein
VGSGGARGRGGPSALRPLRPSGFARGRLIQGVRSAKSPPATGVGRRCAGPGPRRRTQRFPMASSPCLARLSAR